ncbi:MAG: precorrin-6y C5,15-methyltransferase (decarboxylating) subunit CbiE [Rhodospirillales bacterium]
MSLPIIVIGIGEDGPEGLGQTAREALSGATQIAGAKRHLAMLPDTDKRPRHAWGKDLIADINKLATLAEQETVCVLASGDPLQHGIAVRMIDTLGVDAVRVLPHPGAFALSAARMGWSLSDPMLTCISVHAEPFAALRRAIQPNVRLLILSRNGDSPQAVTETLNAMGYGTSPVTVLEHIGGASEKRTDGFASAGFAGSFQNLNTVCVHCIATGDAVRLSHAPGLADDAFDHDGTITKREVRAVTLAALGPLPGEVLWDIGAGNGTIAIEWLRVEPRAHAVAFEQDPARIESIRANADALGVPALKIVAGIFPDTIGDDLPKPDVIFIGGGIAGDSDILVAAYDALKPGGRLVANAVTLQAQAHLITAEEVLGGDLVSIGIAKSAAVGDLKALKPAIEVLQWRTRKS